MKLVCYFDGACEPKNPGGNMGIGALVRMGYVTVFQCSSFVPANFNNSNNVAEYLALEQILDYLLDLKEDYKGYEVTIHGDSMLVINQMLGQWKMNPGKYYGRNFVSHKYYEHGMRCKVKLDDLRQFMSVGFGWVRRTENTIADELSKAELIKHNVEFKIQPVS